MKGFIIKIKGKLLLIHREAGMKEVKVKLKGRFNPILLGKVERDQQEFILIPDSPIIYQEVARTDNLACNLSKILVALINYREVARTDSLACNPNKSLATFPLHRKADSYQHKSPKILLSKITTTLLKARNKEADIIKIYTSIILLNLPNQQF